MEAYGEGDDVGKRDRAVADFVDEVEVAGGNLVVEREVLQPVRFVLNVFEFHFLPYSQVEAGFGGEGVVARGVSFGIFDPEFTVEQSGDSEGGEKRSNNIPIVHGLCQ